ncbi:hypothetical protein IWW48_001300 [Coemansia sp. RSA 1200]|nr:hypothetical protein IWW48_001300 [Coemansia sp. RSA 1200]
MVETRRRRQPKAKASNQYYVGYVEDDESVDAIMKKFEELERIEKEFSTRKKPDAEPGTSAGSQKPGSSAEVGSEEGTSRKASNENVASTATDEEIAAALQNSVDYVGKPRGEEGMSMELLEEVFKRTSAFTVRGAMMDDLDFEVMDDIELWQAEAGGDIPSEWEEEEDYITLNLDDDALDDEFGVVLPRRRYAKRDSSKRSTGPRLTSRDQIIQRYKYMQVRVQDRHGHTFFVSRKVNAVDPSMPTYVRIPPNPIPRSWVKHIRPLVADAESTPKSVVSGVLIPKTEPKWSRLIHTDATLGFDFSIFSPTFQCIYMDPPLLLPGEDPKPGYFDISKLVAIPVKGLLAPGSFLFTWCEKELIVDMCEMAEDNWGLKYVENFCWVRQQTNNQIQRLPSNYFCRSKVTLLIFRREGDLEIRHQRSPDSMFDFVKPRMPGSLNDRKPEFAYTVIETLLPRAICSDEEWLAASSNSNARCITADQNAVVATAANAHAEASELSAVPISSAVQTALNIPTFSNIPASSSVSDGSSILDNIHSSAIEVRENEKITLVQGKMESLASKSEDDILSVFAAYSGAAYTVTDQWNCRYACEYPGTEGTVVEYHWDVSFPLSAGYIARNSNSKIIVVAFQGTSNPTQWADNLDIELEQWPPAIEDSKVHSGFLRGYLNARDSILTNVQRIASEYPDYSITFVGHSLGGARASLAVLDLSISVPELLPRVYLYTQGQPRTGNKAFANAMDALSVPKYREVYEYDIVPHILPELLGYAHFKTEIWIHNNDTILCIDPIKDNSCSESSNIPHPLSISDHEKYPGLKYE